MPTAEKRLPRSTLKITESCVLNHHLQKLLKEPVHLSFIEAETIRTWRL
jgi:hypothetical protein